MNPNLFAQSFRKFCLSPYFKGKSRIESVIEPLIPMPSKPVEIDGEFSLDLNPKSPFERGIYFRNCEQDTYDFFKEKISDGMSVVDCGANIGFFTLLAAHLVGKNGKVYSFEATPPTFDRLKSNVERNNFNNVELHNCALGDKEGEVKIHVLNSANLGMNSLAAPENSEGQSYPCPMRPLDSFNIDADFIKIDVEGAEKILIEGAKNTLLNGKPPTIVLEVSKHTSNAFGYEPEELVTQLLDIHNYKIEWWHMGKRIKVAPNQRLPHYDVVGEHHGSNYFFIP